MTRAVVLLAHGARDPRWAEPFAKVAATMRLREPGLLVELAFLELMAPDLPALAQQLADEGATRIDVVPMFLGAGGHLRNDVPPLVERVRTARPDLEVRLHPAIGEHASVIEALAGSALALASFGE